MPLYFPPGNGSSGSVATDTIYDAKGDLPVGTGANTAARLAVGANGTVLMADSGEATGVKWGTVAGTGDVTAAVAFTNDNRLLRSDGTGKGAQASSVSLTDTADMSGVATLVVTSSAAIGTAATNGELAILNDAGGSITLSVPSVTLARVVDFPDVAGTIAVGTFNSQYNVAGDILYASAADTGARLAIGTANQLLQTNAGATAPEWTSTIAPTTVNATTLNASAIRPATDDGAALGDTTHNFSDLHLATGGTINYQNGNVVLTHGSGLLTVTTGEFRITTPGTNAASVPTLGSTSTFTNKTLTAPTVGGISTLSEGAAFLLDSVLSADGTFTGTAIPGTAGATLAFGDAIYLDPTDSRWELTDANAAAGADGDCRGLVGVCILAAAADGDPTRILVHGTVRADTACPSFTVGAPVYFSETAGDLTNTAPVTTDSVARIIGWAIDANSILVSPSGLWDTHA
jgi:hypothetical protein